MPKNATKTTAKTVAPQKPAQKPVAQKPARKPVSPAKPVAPVAVASSNVRDGVPLTDRQAQVFDFMRDADGSTERPYKTRPMLAQFLFGGNRDAYMQRTGEAGARIFALALPKVFGARKLPNFAVLIGRDADGRTQNYRLISKAEFEAEEAAEKARLAKLAGKSKSATKRPAKKTSK